MALLAIIFAIASFKDQEERGELFQSLLIFFVFMGVFGGYYSARYYKMFEGQFYYRCACLTATLYPMVLFCIFFELNVCFAI